MTHSFDRIISRDGTSSVKYDARASMFGNAEVLPLWVADMDFASPPAVTAALSARAEHPIYGYSVFPESLYGALIDWLKTRHGWQVEREWILLCPGVVPSLYASINALTAVNDAIIVQPPVYMPFFTAVTDTGRQLLENPLQLETSGESSVASNPYTIDFEHLETCAAKARMLILCSPHNPVGRVWRVAELERLLEIAEKYNLTIFSDEIHSDLIYSEHKHQVLQLLSAQQANIITAVAPSKTFNIPGLNLSALIIPDATQRNAVAKVFASAHVSASNPFSMAAFEAAYQGGGVWLDELMAYLKQTLDFVQAYATEHLPQIRVIVPEGTYLIWLDCRGLGMTDAALRQFFIAQAGVGLSPGTAFGKAGSGFMRMNIAAPRQVVEKALQQIASALAKLKRGS